MATSLTPFEIYMLLSMMTKRLDYNNYIVWCYQFQTLLEGLDLFGYIDGVIPCPTKNAITANEGVTCEISAAYNRWKKTDKALLSLLLATLDDDILDIVVGSKSSREAWMCLQERFSSTSRANIMQLKTDIQTIKKGSDSIERYLLRIKQARDKLCAVGVIISDEDIMVLTLNGLPDEYAMLKMVICGRETPITAKDFRLQLLAAERDVERFMNSSSSIGTMFARAHPQTSHGCNSYCFSAEEYNGGYRSPRTNNVRNYKGNHRGKPYGGNPNNDQGKFYAQKSNTWNGNNKSRGSGSFNDWNDGEAYRNNFGLSAKCQICKKTGHIAINCWYRNSIPLSYAIPLSYPSNSMITCQICGLKGHAALDCRYRSTYTFQGAELPSTPTTMTEHISNKASFSGLSSLVPSVGTNTFPVSSLSSSSSAAVPASVERGNTSGNVENHGGGGNVVVGGSENNSGGDNSDMDAVVGGSENNSGGDNGDMGNNVCGGNIFEGDSGSNSTVGGDNGDMGNNVVGGNIFEGDIGSNSTVGGENGDMGNNIVGSNIFEGDSGSNSTVGSSSDSSGSSGSTGINKNLISDINTNERFISTPILPQELQFVPDPATSYNNHSMLTRAKNGIFKKKSFDEFCAYSCIAQWNVLAELSFFSGLTSVIDIVDVAKHFKAVVGHVEWENAMRIAVSICRFLFATQLQLSCELQSAQDQASKQLVVPTRIKYGFDKKMSCQDLCAFSCVTSQKMKQETTYTYRHNDVFICPEKYAKELVHDAGIDTSRSCSVPCESHLQVLKSEDENLGYPAKPLLPAQDSTVYATPQKEGKSKNSKEISYIISGNQISGNKGNHNGTFVVGSKAKHVVINM